MSQSPEALQTFYGSAGLTEDEVYARLDTSLAPRGPISLYDKLGALGASSAHRVLDAGCRDARHACELTRRFGCRVLGVDPLPEHIQRAQQLISEQGLAHAVEAVLGRIESIPAEPGSFDFIWCRDVLNHLPDLAEGLGECARVLKRGGSPLNLVFRLRRAPQLTPPWLPRSPWPRQAGLLGRFQTRPLPKVGLG